MKIITKLKIIFLFIFTYPVYSEVNSELEEVVVKGKVLYQDQVSALKTPVPILNVPQTVSIITDEEILAALSYIKSTWSSRIQRQHDQINASAKAQ